jgi:2-hydroxychromene-2-carboxylate isomerase
MSRAVFLFDLGSPYAYLAAERLDEVLGARVAWRPVSLGGLFKLNGRSSWGLGPGRAEGMAEIERRARERGLPPLRWPDPWPGHMLAAMRGAVVAQDDGIAREYALAAFRAAFAGGRDLSDVDAVLSVAASVGLDEQRVRERIAAPDVKQRLIDATERAHRAGVPGVPAVIVGEEVFWGDDRLEEAAAAAARRSAP